MEQFSQRVYQNKTPYFSIRHRVLRLMPRRLAVWVLSLIHICIGVNDEFGHSGPAAALLKQFGLSAEHIVEVATKLCK